VRLSEDVTTLPAYIDNITAGRIGKLTMASIRYENDAAATL
jgi:hypothetical protein